MNEAQFIKINSARWQKFESLLRSRQRKRFAVLEDAWTFPQAYRKLCRDLNQAKSERYSLGLIETINRQVWAGHQILYRKRSNSPAKALRLLVSDFPAQLRRHGKAFLLCHLLFYGLVLLAFIYGRMDTHHLESFLGQAMVDNLRQMYDPSNSNHLRPEGVSSDAQMFAYYINHNISIGFRTFASGIFAGLGSLLALILNALLLGGAMAVMDGSGFNGTFYPFILGHGAFELTAIIIFALAGFELGKVMIMPGRRSRLEYLRSQGKEVLPLVVGATIFLFIAACLEGFWSAHSMAAAIKYGVAAVLWILVYAFILFGGRHARH